MKDVQNSKADPDSSQTTNSTLFPNNPYNFTDLKPTTNQYHKYPVINLSFECFIAVDSFKEAVKFYKRVVHRLFKDHKYLTKSERLSLHDRKLVQFWSDDHNFYTFSTEQVMKGLRELTRLICRHWDSRCWVLLDDYDHVVQAAMMEMADNDKFRRVVKFTYRMITHAFRNNSDCVYGAVVAGELSLAVFGVKDYVKYKMYNFLEDHEFVKYFGLTSEDVEGVLYSLSKNKTFRTEVEKNCGGYITSSGEKLFNINLLNRFLNGEKSNHGSEVKDELRNIVKIPLFREILETLLEGETVDFHKIDVFDLDDLVDLRSILLNIDLEITPRIFNLLISYLFHKGILAYSEPTNQTANTMNISYAKIPNNYMKEAIKSVLY
ncbi:uncharacterized protein LOC128983283 [Macrosteles quadrilineatus]|uniref:uncharacterized protein LOC128983283 n=1 Tax=Macrosteles quadrilineatus TaxID=74068 RepID=UPI0023E33C0A|nr:uncharacterized protein LOC128983283 [Macrosteles quadrilineatus]